MLKLPGEWRRIIPSSTRRTFKSCTAFTTAETAVNNSTMVVRHSLARPLRAVARPASRPSSCWTPRTFATSSVLSKNVAAGPSEFQNMRYAPRGQTGKLQAPIVNPAGA